MWKICIGEATFTEIYRIITVHDLLQSISSDPCFAFDYYFHYFQVNLDNPKCSSILP